MVSFKNIITGAAIVALSPVVSGKSVVNSLAGYLSNAIVDARHSDYPEASAKSDASRLAAFVTDDHKLSAYYESAIQTAESSTFNPSIASAYLTSIISVVSSVTNKPDFYNLIKHVINVASDYDTSALSVAFSKELGPYGTTAYSKLSSVYVTDKGISSLVETITSELFGVATKVIAHIGPNLLENSDDLDMSEYLAQFPGITDFWAMEENNNN